MFSPTRRRPVVVRILSVLVALAVVWLPSRGPSSAQASLVLAMELPDLVEAAEHIVLAEVTNVSSAWSPDRERILTTVELNVAEAWKGPQSQGRRVTLVQPGGVVGEIEMRVHGMPTFTVGERSVLFLTGTPARVVGLGQGRRFLRFDRPSRRWMVEGGDRSAAVTRALDGALDPAAPEKAESLDGLRSRVRALVARVPRGGTRSQPDGEPSRP